jgi:TRAP-type mannitol/chloroaromatic compound transport system permease small subunit
MHEALRTLLKWIDSLSIFIGKTASWLIIPIVLLQVYEALARYFFKSPTIWTWELALLLYGVHFFLGGAWVLQENRHVRTDVLLMRYSPKIKALLEFILFSTIFSVFMYVMVSTAWEQAIKSIAIQERTFNEWAPPFYPVKVLIAISFSLLALQGFANALRSLLFLITGQEETGHDAH